MGWARNVACVRTNANRIVVDDLKVRDLLGRPGHVLDDNIEAVLKELSYRGVDSINLAQGRNRWLAIVN
jgi:hypothetical protein